MYLLLRAGNLSKLSKDLSSGGARILSFTDVQFIYWKRPSWNKLHFLHPSLYILAQQRASKKNPLMMGFKWRPWAPGLNPCLASGHPHSYMIQKEEEALAKLFTLCQVAKEWYCHYQRVIPSVSLYANNTPRATVLQTQNTISVPREEFLEPYSLLQLLFY